MTVVDASALSELLVASTTGSSVEAALREHGTDLEIPHLCVVETTSVLRRWVRAGIATPGRAEAALRDLEDLPATRYPHEVVLQRVWELRDTLSAYDACYVALAEALRVPLITTDRRMARATGHHAVVVTV